MSVGTLLRNQFTYSTIKSHFGGTSEKELPHIFKTSKGSMYFGNATGRTLRFKTPHMGHNPNDVGWKQPSDKTLYVKPEDAKEIAKGIFFYKRWLVLSGEKNHLVYIYVHNGMVKVVREIEYSTTPSVGLSPIEFLRGKQSDTPSHIYCPNDLHVGNEITEVY